MSGLDFARTASFRASINLSADRGFINTGTISRFGEHFDRMRRIRMSEERVTSMLLEEELRVRLSQVA